MGTTVTEALAESAKSLMKPGETVEVTLRASTMDRVGTARARRRYLPFLPSPLRAIVLTNERVIIALRGNWKNWIVTSVEGDYSLRPAADGSFVDDSQYVVNSFGGPLNIYAEDVTTLNNALRRLSPSS